jgi:SNF2 family DNA or RNA helicase
LYITGDKTPLEREETKKIFHTDPKCRVIIINTAVREAINLQIASTLIFFNLDWSYGNFLQIVGRINRLGSEHDLNTIYMLLNKGTIDEYVYLALLKKETYFSELLGSVGYSMDNTNLHKFISNFTEFSKPLLKGK